MSDMIQLSKYILVATVWKDAGIMLYVQIIKIIWFQNTPIWFCDFFNLINNSIYLFINYVCIY